MSLKFKTRPFNANLLAALRKACEGARHLGFGCKGCCRWSGLIHLLIISHTYYELLHHVVALPDLPKRQFRVC